eukprot:EC124503.1.p1 GENE.EC124503.1~~EC124503.1.p1  ORF type:complete len:169 (+),score=20.22 EC124503.1:176-682(+)
MCAFVSPVAVAAQLSTVIARDTAQSASVCVRDRTRASAVASSSHGPRRSFSSPASLRGTFYGASSFRASGILNAFPKVESHVVSASLDEASVFERVKKVVVDELKVEDSAVTSEAHFIKDFGADSLDLVELVMALEREFDIEIPDSEAQKMETIQDVINYALASAPAA